MKQAEPITPAAAGFRQHLEGYVSLTDEEYAAGLTYFSRVSLQKGEYLIQPGNQVTHTYWVKKGLSVSSFSSGAGKEHVVQFASEHCWVTDQHAFYNQIFASFSLQALGPALLLCLSYQNCESLWRYLTLPDARLDNRSACIKTASALVETEKTKIFH